jgi:hypothetical protein
MVAYQFFLPPLDKTRRARDKATQADVHLGLVAATTVSLGTAVLLANLAGNRTPIYASVFVAVIIAFVYEYASTNTGVMEKR